MTTFHNLFIGSSKDMNDLNEPIHLVVTSPPYPMIEMWDTLFQSQGCNNYETMHELLANVWRNCYNKLVDGGLMCINIGDSTRKNRQAGFSLYPNHSKVTEHCQRIGFTTLPYILWKKPTNRPNAFLGSGFIPPNGYITLDCEFILIFRKGQIRKFPPKDPVRYDSSFTKEERNKWFSQIWDDVRGTRQNHNGISRRTGAFPEEIARRLIRMFSVKGETVLDPFLGTGTTMKVAKDLQRNSIGYETDRGLVSVIKEKVGINQATLNGSHKFDIRFLNK